MIGRMLFHYVGWNMEVVKNGKDKELKVDTSKTSRGIRNAHYLIRKKKASDALLRGFIEFCYYTW